MNQEYVIKRFIDVGLEARRHIGDKAVVVSPQFRWDRTQTIFDPDNCCWIMYEDKVWIADIMHYFSIRIKVDERLEHVINSVLAYYELSGILDKRIENLKHILSQLHDNHLDVEIQANKDIKVDAQNTTYTISVGTSGEYYVTMYKDKNHSIYQYENLQACVNAVIQFTSK